MHTEWDGQRTTKMGARTDCLELRVFLFLFFDHHYLDVVINEIYDYISILF
jgi:hypothetical protein